jgi:hypothetical protein
MKLLHTKGPWGGGGGRAMPITADIDGVGRQIGSATDCNGLIPDDEVVANVFLMRASPTMLAALLMVADDPGLTASANEVIKAAITEAVYRPEDRPC